MAIARRFPSGIAVVCLALAGAALAAEPDAEGCKDPQAFTRLRGFYISRCEPKDFETHAFRDQKGNEVQVEGRYTFVLYGLKSGATEPSRIQIQRNYQNAIKDVGGTALFDDGDGSVYLRLAKDGKELWVHVNAYITTEYSIAIVEKAAMAQDVKANAEAFSSDLKATGHAAVYGIYFDTGKAVLKPESDAAISEIARLLKGDPALKLHVVGHTDAVGAVDANLKLSQARADAVIAALTGKHGIAAARLRGAGVGPLAPVASNDAEEGRAKNRRVELVKQ